MPRRVMIHTQTPSLPSLLLHRLRGGDDITGADDALLDEELHKVMADIVAGAVNSVEMIEDTPLVQSIIEAGNKVTTIDQLFPVIYIENTPSHLIYSFKHHSLYSFKHHSFDILYNTL